MALLPLPPSAPMNQDLVFSLACCRWMVPLVLLNPLHLRDPPDPPDPPDPTVTSNSKPPPSSSLRDPHQTPSPSSPPISLASLSTSGIRTSCFFHEICYRGLNTKTTQICLTGGATLSVVHVSSPSSIAMAPGCSPSFKPIRVGYVKDLMSFESPLTASHWISNSISKQVRLQPVHPKDLCLLSDAYSHTINKKECVDCLLKFHLVRTSWSRHGNVKVPASNTIKRYASSQNSILLRASLIVKLEFEIHLVSWISLTVFRADRERFKFKSRQLRPLDTIVVYASQSASPSPALEINLVSLVRFVEVTADFAVERYSPASSFSMRSESSPVFKPVSNSSKSLSLGYFYGGMPSALHMALTLEFSKLKVISDISTLVRAISGNLQSKEIIGIVKDIRSISSGFASFSFSSSVLAKWLFKPSYLCNELQS